MTPPRSRKVKSRVSSSLTLSVSDPSIFDNQEARIALEMAIADGLTNVGVEQVNITAIRSARRLGQRRLSSSSNLVVEYEVLVFEGDTTTADEISQTVNDLQVET